MIGGLATVVLLVLALWAARIDLASASERNSAPLEWLAVGYKVLSAAGLAIVAHRLRSRSMYLLAALVAALVLGSLVIDAGWFNSTVGELASRLDDVLPVSAAFLELGTLFVGLGVVAGWLVYAAYRRAEVDEKPMIHTVIGLLFVVGVFLGPINAISALGINREWLFAEDFGQAVSLALLVGYTVGLVVASAGSPRLPE